MRFLNNERVASVGFDFINLCIYSLGTFLLILSLGQPLSSSSEDIVVNQDFSFMKLPV